MGLRFEGVCVDAANPTVWGTWWSDAHGEQSWAVLADPEGNEFCVLAVHG